MCTSPCCWPSRPRPWPPSAAWRPSVRSLLRANQAVLSVAFNGGRDWPLLTCHESKTQDDSLELSILTLHTPLLSSTPFSHLPIVAAQLYDATRDFKCLDGSATIKFAAVNDDYCDCADGSDEPGLS